jgi:DNA-binding transcriptional MerR regulator
MPVETYDIQKLITESGVPRRTIHFYVQQGILPPPQGAGLAAFYTEEHLLRLRLIPILRQQGLRLDEIRQRFSEINPEEMRRLVSAGTPVLVRRAVNEVHPPVYGGGEQRYVHYNLPAGMTLVVPEPVSLADRQRLNMLLQSARQIFSVTHPKLVVQDPRQRGPAPDSADDGDPQPIQEE